MSEISSAFGENFYEKYKETLAKLKYERYAFTEETKKAIIKEALEKMQPESSAIQFMHQGNLYHVILAETTSDLSLRELDYGYSFYARWLGKGLTVTIRKDQIDKIGANQAYLFVGLLKERVYNNKKYLNMSVQEVITMKDIEELTK